MNRFNKILWITILMLPFYANAQINEVVHTLDSVAKNKLIAIPTINIIQKIEEANAEIKSAEKKKKINSEVIKIDSLFPGYVLFIKKQKKREGNFVKSSPNKQKIDNLILRWEGYQSYLNNWQSVTNKISKENLRLIGRISIKEKVWDLTYKNAIFEKVPIEVSNSANVVLNKFKNSKKSLIKNNNNLLRLEAKINKQEIIVNDVIEELHALKNSQAYNLFYLRHKPLWKESFGFSKENNGEKDVVESFSGNISGIFKFVRTSESNIYLFILIIAFNILIFNRLKKIYLKYPFNEEDGDLQNAKDIIVNHRVSGVIFFTLLLAKIYFSNTPLLFGDVIILLLLIVSISFIQPYIYKRFKKVIYFLILFFLFDSIKTFIWFSASQYRIYLLVENIMVLGSLYYFTHPYLKTREMKIGKFGKFLIKVTPIIFVLSIVSIISNILGYTNLADITLKIILQSSIITIIFYGVLMILEGIIIGLIHRYFSKNQPYDQNIKIKIELKVLKVIRVLTFLYWLFYFLKVIDLLKPLTEYINNILKEPYEFGSITLTIGAIFSFILILVFSFLITNTISFIFDSSKSIKFLKLSKGVPAAISLVIRYFIIAFGFVFALSALGIDLSKFNLMAGALGLGIGFGLQNVISNFISGLILVFERPILLGDTVEVNNLLGTVNRIGVRSSNIRTFDGAEVVVPNNNLIANDLINWTLSDNIKRVEILIGTTYGSDPNVILKILFDVASESKYALKTPPPIALFSEFGDSSLNFKLRFWVHYEKGLEAKSDVSIAIYNRFKEKGIEIPFPQQDIYIKDMPQSLENSEVVKKNKDDLNKEIKPDLNKDIDN